MKNIKIITYIIVSILVVCSGTISAQEAILQTQTSNLDELRNQVIVYVYEEILKVKDNYPELEDFGQNSLEKDADGYYFIRYKTTARVEDGQNSFYEPFEFGVSLIEISKINPYEFEDETFDFSFGLLGLKFSGYQLFSKEEDVRREQFNVLDPIRTQGRLLLDAQQEYIPFRLTIEPAKEVFSSDEAIEFTLNLTNVDSQSFYVKPLTEQTLYFLFGKQPWGTSDPNVETENILLKPGETISNRFAVDGFSPTDELEVFVTYNFTYKGVNPHARTTIRIIEPGFDENQPAIDDEAILKLAREAATSFCMKYDFPQTKIYELEQEPIFRAANFVRDGKTLTIFRWLGGGRGDYYVQPEVNQQTGEVIVYGGFQDREFGPWQYK